MEKTVVPAQSSCTPKDEESIVYYYESADPHDARRCENGLSAHVKAIVEEILKDGHKSLIPLTKALISRGVEPIPPRKQLQNYLRNRQKLANRQRILCLGELRSRCQSREIPEPEEDSNGPDLDEPFVVNSYFHYEGAQTPEEESVCMYRVFISTLRLLKISKAYKQMQPTKLCSRDFHCS